LLRSNFPLQATATKEIYGAASRGNEGLVKKYIAAGANVDEHRGWVRVRGCKVACFNFSFEEWRALEMRCAFLCCVAPSDLEVVKS